MAKAVPVVFAGESPCACPKTGLNIALIFFGYNIRIMTALLAMMGKEIERYG